MRTVPQIRRRLSRAIHWTPAHDSHFVVAAMRRAAVRIDPLYVTQPAIAACEAHVRGTQVVPFGLLVGTACVCPRTKVEYLLLDEALSARIELTPDEPDAQLAAELRALVTVAESRDKLVLGWYLGGMDEDLRLDAELERLHRDLFPDAWQVALVRGHGTEAEHGAFLRLDPLEARFYAVPFFELSPDSAQHGAERLTTVVAWGSYRTRQPVVSIGANAPGLVQPVEIGSSRHLETSVRRWLGSFRSQRPDSANSPSSPVRPPAVHPPADRLTAAPQRRSEARDVPFELRRASVAPSPVQPSPELTPAPAQSLSLTDEVGRVMPQPVAPPPSAPEAVALEPLSAGASDVAASPQSYLPPATVEVTDPAPEVAFPVLPGEASAARLRLPKIERRRLMLFGITALMLLEALWLLRILR